MRIGVIGTGYVGLVQGVVLAEFGHQVICMDTDLKKIDKLKNGRVPIYEKGLEDLLKKNTRHQRLLFTTDIKKTVEDSTVIFIAVGTPPREDGSADLNYVEQVAKDIGDNINGYKVIVTKSTVPISTGTMIKEIINKKISQNGRRISFDIVSNPEFLREGMALTDCLNPARIIIGTESNRAKKIMNKVYSRLIAIGTPVVYTNVATSEMIKYASNSFLAVKISFINEIALLAERTGADIEVIAQAMGMDSRISPKFLQAGPGYGGSCFPKDTRAIVETAREYNEELYVVEAAIRANQKQKYKMFEKIINAMGSVAGKTIAVLGLSFKPETDDVREAPSMDIIRNLIGVGAEIKAYCPKGMKEAMWRLEDVENSIEYCEDPYIACKNSCAIVVITEWKEFLDLDYDIIYDSMEDNYLFDLRNMFANDENVQELFKYHPTGKP